MKPSYFFLTVTFLFAVLDILVLLRVNALLRPLPNRRYLRGILVAWSVVAIGFCTAWLFFNRILGGTHDPVARPIVACEYIWHFLLLPILVLGLLIELLIRMMRGGWRRLWVSTEPATPEASPSSRGAGLSRRQFLTAAAFVAGPAATAGLSGVGVSQIGKFRMRFFDLNISTLPAALDNYSITVIADVHTGVFSTQKMLDDIVEASNRLRSDLVLLPGDLINISLADVPAALDMALRLDSRDGVYLIQGNHDVVQGPEQFNDAVRRRGVKILVDEATTINARGVQFQLLGTRWEETTGPRDASVAFTAALRDPSMFAIMMAHHPHSWDVAADCGIPLVISGHTHGGQIMLTRNIGLGRLRFKYLSGEYNRPGSTLIVSNGVGNWFPLRIGAPAEILRITLHPSA
jgi:predicted MPP superfamily phosphohydrolase